MRKKSIGFLVAGALCVACLAIFGFSASRPSKSPDAGVLSDPAMGLMWVEENDFARLFGADEDGLVTWPQALSMVAAMNSGEMPNFGYSDWRLPSEVELRHLQLLGFGAGHPGKMAKGSGYWLERSITPHRLANAGASSELNRKTALAWSSRCGP